MTPSSHDPLCPPTGARWDAAYAQLEPLFADITAISKISKCSCSQLPADCFCCFVTHSESNWRAYSTINAALNASPPMRHDSWVDKVNVVLRDHEMTCDLKYTEWTKTRYHQRNSFETVEFTLSHLRLHIFELQSDPEQLHRPPPPPLPAVAATTEGFDQQPRDANTFRSAAHTVPLTNSLNMMPARRSAPPLEIDRSPSSQWTKIYSEEYGQMYWHNTVSGDSSWADPMTATTAAQPTHDDTMLVDSMTL